MKYPAIQPMLVRSIQRQGRGSRPCKTSHWNTATMNPEMTSVSPGIKLPNSHPQVVAMIQKNHRTQSKERIRLTTTAASTLDGTGEQAAHEVALQGEEH